MCWEFFVISFLKMIKSFLFQHLLYIAVVIER